MSKKQKRTLGQELLEGLNDALAFERGEKVLKTNTVELPVAIKKVSKATVSKVRKEVLRASQPVFAQYLNVSDSTIRSWEQGQKEPCGSAALLVQLFRTYPAIMTALRHFKVEPDKADKLAKQLLQPE